MLDDINIIKQRDPNGALAKADELFIQTDQAIEVAQASHDDRPIKNIVVAGMGGSSLAADAIRSLLHDRLKIPFEVVKDYELPAHVDENTLVITSSYSGNTEETIACFRSALHRGCQLAGVASGGKLIELATENQVAYIKMPSGMQPRMAMIINLRSILTLIQTFGIDVGSLLDDIAESKSWLQAESQRWSFDSPIERNYAKQLALISVGKTPVFYSGPLTAPIAYKWKISWNENAKNLAFCNQYPEFNHNEFIGWSGHPIEKPFVIFDIVSEHEPIRIDERMKLSDQLLSGLRPKANQIHLAGETLAQEMLWGSVLADYASIYVAILNGVNPEPVALVEKFKKQLS